MKRMFSVPARPAGKPAPITARGPHECVPLTPQQFRSALDYVTRAALSSVRAPKEFFPENSPIPLLKSEELKVTLLAAYAHFKSDANLALSFFYRYRGMGLVASSSLLKQWVIFDPSHDTVACFYPSIIHVFAHLPMNRDGLFDPQQVRDAAIEICEGFPGVQAAADEASQSASDQRVAA